MLVALMEVLFKTFADGRLTDVAEGAISNSFLKKMKRSLLDEWSVAENKAMGYMVAMWASG